MNFALCFSFYNQGISSKGCQEDADESALRHAVKLLQDNGELNEHGFVLRRNDKPTQGELQEFFEFPNSSEV